MGLREKVKDYEEQHVGKLIRKDTKTTGTSLIQNYSHSDLTNFKIIKKTP